MQNDALLQQWLTGRSETHLATNGRDADLALRKGHALSNNCAQMMVRCTANNAIKGKQEAWRHAQIGRFTCAVRTKVVSNREQLTEKEYLTRTV